MKKVWYACVFVLVRACVCVCHSVVCTSNTLCATDKLQTFTGTDGATLNVGSGTRWREAIYRTITDF
jgi:hypothetical protein